MPPVNPQAKTIFGQALAVETPAERSAFLTKACGDDAALRSEVDGLLAALEGAGSFLQRPVADLGVTVDSAPERALENVTPTPNATEEVGSRIGPYRLVQRLGEGGMGAVWVAEQTEPVKRRVALKVIKPGMDSAQVLRRFEAERQALALMDHTHIARVYDAGATATGRPYFVMELIKGVPITTYCDELQLPIRERLQLFIPVCQAVQHAHQKGIIHRDIKPSNVLVCIQDGRPVAKVIDFGVAKALHQKLADKTMETEIGQIVGTLEYMSPEQAELSALDVDTRADVYALGVLLYELLTGTTPLDKKRLKTAAILELLRVVREEEPPRPSTRLTDSKDVLPSLAAQRRTEPDRLTKEVRGELDWIVMKCLEKDRTRRYETASDLARDVEHYLHDEAVEACPPSAGYRLKKLLRRHKGPVAAAAAVFLVLVIGIAASAWQAVRTTRAEAEARRQRDHAESARHEALAERDAKEQARAQAETNERQAKAVRDFLQIDLLRQADPIEQAERLRGLDDSGFMVRDNPTIKELLERTAAELAPDRIEGKFPGQPLVQAAILATVGNAFRGVGEHDRAVAHLERAVGLMRAHVAFDDPDSLTIHHDLANALGDAEKYAESIALYEKVRDARIARLGANHRDTLATLYKLAVSHYMIGKKPEGIEQYLKVCDAQIAALGSDDPDTLTTQQSLALAYYQAGRSAESMVLLEQVRDSRIARLGPTHPQTIGTFHDLALIYLYSGKQTEAVDLYEKVRDAHITQLGAEHPTTLSACNDLAIAYRRVRKFDESIALFAKVRDVRVAKLGPDHGATLGTLNSMARAYRLAGKHQEAIEIFEKVRDARVRLLGWDHPDTMFTLMHLGTAYGAANKTTEAIDVYERLCEWRKERRGADHVETLDAMHNLAVQYRNAEQYDRSISLFEKVRDGRIAVLGADHLDTVETQYQFAYAYRLAGRFNEAIALYEKVRDSRIAKWGPTNPLTLNVMQYLAITYRNAGKKSEAIALNEKVRDGRIAELGPDHPDTLRTFHYLGLAYKSASRDEDALTAYLKAMTGQVDHLGPKHADTVATLNDMNILISRGAVGEKMIEFHGHIRDVQIAKLGLEHPATQTTIERIDGYYKSTIDMSRKYKGVELPRRLAACGLNLIKANKPAEAEPLLRESLPVREKKEAHSWTTFHTKALLGASLLGQKKYADAEPLLLAGYEGMKQREAKIPTQDLIRLHEALERLVQLYEATGAKEKADEWRNKQKEESASPKPLAKP